MRKRPVVFAGPSLPWRPGPEWRRLLARCDLRPPAGRGDVLAALAAPAGPPHTLVLIDGYYFTVPAVTHKEILYALDAGVRVIGAASLGALRAAELAPFGMEGVGEVYARYRDGEIDGDDEVALLHAPGEHGYRPLTVALVELRHALDALVAAGEVDPAAGRRLIGEVKALSFLDRRAERIEGLAYVHLGVLGGSALLSRLQRVSIKAGDARLAIESALAPEGVQPPREPRRRVLSGYLGGYLESYLPALPSPPRGRGSPSLLQAWRMAQLFHPEAAGFVREIRRRSLLAAAVLREGLVVPPAILRRRTEELRQLHREELGALFLPAPEYAEEARSELLAAAAGAGKGGAGAALARLAREMGLPAGDDETLLRVVAGGSESIPSWWLVRAFALRPAFAAAAGAARAAAEVDRCFVRWADGARVVEADLRRLAAGLWGCAPEAVEGEAARRGIFASSLSSSSIAGPAGAGWREAVERVAAAERLPRPINDYRERRDALARSPLTGQEKNPTFVRP